jgi:prepilin-type N-terminal cleavage/methylation domain-containing protein
MKRVTHRSGFTMIEVLTSAMVSGLVAATGAVLVSAVSNASAMTRDVRAQKMEGHFVLDRLGRTIREARGIGKVSGTSVSVWLEDKNGDDTMNLYETAVISYDAVKKQILFEHLEPASGITPVTIVTVPVFTDTTQLKTAIAAATAEDQKAEVWASEIESLTFTGYPNNTETRIVQTRFTVGTGSTVTAFWGSASPRASADYLYNSKTQTTPPVGSTRKSRKHYSRWAGFADITGAAVPPL